jgi:hypothetical protein
VLSSQCMSHPTCGRSSSNWSCKSIQSTCIRNVCSGCKLQSGRIPPMQLEQSSFQSHLLINITTNVYRNGGKDYDTGSIKMTVSTKMLCLSQLSEAPPVSPILPSTVLHVSTHQSLSWCDFCCKQLSQYHGQTP